jgi:hypothetical protein
MDGVDLSLAKEAFALAATSALGHRGQRTLG